VPHSDHHAHLDAIAWRTIHERPLPKSDPVPPRNFAELRQGEGPEFAEAVDTFLERFYSHRSRCGEKFFEVEPPLSLRSEYRAFLAGMTEFLCHEFKLPVPQWTEKKNEYFLKTEWDAALDLDEIPWVAVIPIEDRRERSAPEFLRRGIIFPARGLIRV
jgi:hypothetical protein